MWAAKSWPLSGKGGEKDMSRIGRKPIAIPSGVDFKFADGVATVKGPKGTLTQKVHPNMTVTVEGNEVLVARPDDEKENRALHGLTRSLLHNMVVGVTEGFSKNLEINGVGYRAQLQGTKLVLNLGYSHPVEIDPPAGISFECPTPNKITVKGISKQQVGQTAADIRKWREPEPYKGKGIKYDYETVRRKVGKTGK